MSVFMLCSRDAEGAVESKSASGVFLRESYQGCVLDCFHRSSHDDIDYFANVWDEEKQAIVEIGYATTRFWTYAADATVDATPDVRAKAEAYSARKRAALQAQIDAARAAVVGVGDDIVILKAAGRRKSMKGQEARITWVGPNKFVPGEYQARVELVSGEREYFPLSSIARKGHSEDAATADRRLQTLLKSNV